MVTALGRGGRSEVYAVREPLTRRFEALKILVPQYGHDQFERERFCHEYLVTRELEHPNILVPTELGSASIAGGLGREARDTLWLSFPVVAQHSAAVLVPKPGKTPDLGHLEALLGQTASALDYAHAQGVVHLDVKPANVLVAWNPVFTALLADFGVARELDAPVAHARSVSVLASLPYAAPELLSDSRVGPATDQYALACAAVELLTGRPPYPAATAYAVVNAHRAGPPPRLRARAPWLPSAVESVIAKALAKQPALRYPSCSQFVYVLLKVLSYRDVNDIV